MDSVVVHYHELALKGKNRPFFIRRLVKNLLTATCGAGVRQALRQPGRIVLELDENARKQVIEHRLGKVFGVANFSLAYKMPLDIEGKGDSSSFHSHFVG